ncbi:phage virion morphogenesis protein [Rhodococcus sp. HS-D2]|uniref:phage virion morphogenesis protein n=1 Tax=Rhodococcus sp. HS-D2 TaxID=1384636 RepID=UPI0007D930CD|nr:phage virion morphogenesis protein [Rhodococcus sp. HS-D2]
MADATRVHINISGDKDVVAMLGSVGLEVKDMQPAMQDVGKYLKGFFSGEVFASRGGAIGERWPRLSTKYAAWKARKYPGRPVLVRTGVMQKSFTYKSKPLQVTISNKAAHFVYHQSDAPRTLIPYRPMMKVEDGDERYQQIVRIINSRLAQTIKEKGGA